MELGGAGGIAIVLVDVDVAVFFDGPGKAGYFLGEAWHWEGTLSPIMEVETGYVWKVTVLSKRSIIHWTMIKNIPY